MLVHNALDRAAQVARHWAVNGCPVVIHVDQQVSEDAYEAFSSQLSDLPNLLFCDRHRCEWGSWSLVQASQTAAQLMLERFGAVRHVYLASGSCLPLRPVQELVDYLDERPHTDFIESATTDDVRWAVGGLDAERFTLRFPFSWKRQRRLFDGYVRLQRRLGYKRRIPAGLVPHLGSQWWCLTRRTLTAILEDEDRAIFDRYFKRVWIPDESYYQSLVRLYSTNIESRSLTLSKFDFQGKPHTFYDDHLQLLRRSDCFVARKIWPHANRLYDAFLGDNGQAMKRAEPNPGKIDRIFAKAVQRRTRGRAGLYMQSSFPREDWERGTTPSGFSMFQGYTELFEDFEPWLARTTGATVHGHLFAPDKVEFAHGQKIYNGCLTDSPQVRDYDLKGFITNLIWNTRGQRQCFQFGPNDVQGLNWFIAKDPNATIWVITGAWVVPLFHSGLSFAEIRKQAARLQKIESKHMEVLQTVYAKARINVMTMAEFIEAPMEPLQSILDEIGPRKSHVLSEAPRMVNLNGFGEFLQNLKNQGMHPHLMGDFPTGSDLAPAASKPRKPYLVKSRR
ncbi:MAG: glycosyl transferase [Rhodobacterales bacterium]|nr:MAG: glycosyl transferase [Rhodobacterales bacterium]